MQVTLHAPIAFGKKPDVKLPVRRYIVGSQTVRQLKTNVLKARKLGHQLNGFQNIAGGMLLGGFLGTVIIGAFDAFLTGALTISGGKLGAILSRIESRRDNRADMLMIEKAASLGRKSDLAKGAMA
ncbi:MAG: hypothetical protein KTR14_05760 [Vampirovibrio sp.]|nr:hypothetical protein [Vampirovibrio sp.]